MPQVHRIKQIIKDKHMKNKKYPLKYFLFNMSKLIFVNSSFHMHQMPLFVTFLNTSLEFGERAYNQAVAPGRHQTFRTPLVRHARHPSCNAVALK